MIMKRNYLKYKTEKKIGNKIYIASISLDDDCKNGYADFSITGAIYENYKIESNIITAGACHDAILKAFPEFKIFVDLHLSDCEGTPMYAVENGYYFFKRKEYDNVKSYLRISEDELNYLVTNVDDKKHFAYSLYKLGVPQRWKCEAEKAIKMLEDLVGYEYKDESTKLRGLGLSEEEITKIERLESEGYYHPMAIAQRKSEELAKERDKAISEVIESFNKATEKLRREMQVKVYILKYGLPINNFIYYEHRNTGIFNWKGYCDKITKDEFDDFCKNLDRSQLPDGIEFGIEH